MARFTSNPLDLPAADERVLVRADLMFYDVDFRDDSYEARVFIDRVRADVDLSRVRRRATSARSRCSATAAASATTATATPTRAPRTSSTCVRHIR